MGTAHVTTPRGPRTYNAESIEVHSSGALVIRREDGGQMLAAGHWMTARFEDGATTVEPETSDDEVTPESLWPGDVVDYMIYGSPERSGPLVLEGDSLYDAHNGWYITEADLGEGFAVGITDVRLVADDPDEGEDDEIEPTPVSDLAPGDIVRYADDDLVSGPLVGPGDAPIGRGQTLYDAENGFYVRLADGSAGPVGDVYRIGAAIPGESEGTPSVADLNPGDVPVADLSLGDIVEYTAAGRRLTSAPLTRHPATSYDNDATLYDPRHQWYVRYADGSPGGFATDVSRISPAPEAPPTVEDDEALGALPTGTVIREAFGYGDRVLIVAPGRFRYLTAFGKDVSGSDMPFGVSLLGAGRTGRIVYEVESFPDE